MSLSEVQEKVLQLESAIKRLDTVKKHLNRNSSDIKAEIHTSVSRNLECLRSREVTLLSQVDQVQRVKEETLQHQQARLNQTLGVLKTGLSMFLDHTTTERQLADTLEKLNRIELSPEETPYISYRADHVSLRESILNYGRVDASGLPPLIAFNDPGKPSASLPRHVEEYEDVDHHVFYKTLEDVKKPKSSASGNRSITVTIPKLSTRVEDWLQKKVASSGTKTGVFETSARQLPATRPNLLTKASDMPSMGLSGSSTPGGSCSLSNWLSLIKQHADLEEEHDFEIFDISFSKKTGARSSAPNSDVPVAVSQPIKKDLKSWLVNGSACTSKFSSTVFNHIPTDRKYWLAQACQQLTSLEDLKYKDFFQDVSREPSTWLRSRAYVKQQVCSQDGRDGDYFNHTSPDKENWLEGQNKNENKNDGDRSDRVGGTNNSNCRNSCTKADEGKWLLRSAASTPSFQLEDICLTNESCMNISKCVSQPDCLRLCCKEKSPVKSAADFIHAFKPLSLTGQEWLSLEGKQAKCSPTAESGKENSDLFSHIPDASDSIWLMKSHSSSTSDVSKCPSSPDKFKDDKEETNLWLQKTSSTILPDSASPLNIRSESTSVDFCMSDWLLIPAQDKDGNLEDFDQSKEESEA